MKMVPVSSSNVDAVGYDSDKQQLHVRYKNGGTYAYHGVSPEKHIALMGAPSIGKHLHDHIKGRHAHTQIGA